VLDQDFAPDVLHRLRAVEQAIGDDDELTSIVGSRDPVIARFQPIFSEERLPHLTEADFKSFLLFANNKHWTGLERNGPRMCADMATLRDALLLLHDESLDLAERLTLARESVSGMGPNTLTAILLILSPDRYGVWNGKSEAGLKALGVWPKFSGSMGFGDRYMLVNTVLNGLSNALALDLWTLDALFWKLPTLDGKGAPPSATPSSSERPRRWIFQSDPRLYDTATAVTHLQEMAWLAQEHVDDIAVEDTVYLWESGADAGIIATATVRTGPGSSPMPDSDAAFAVEPEKFTGDQMRVKLRIDEVLYTRLTRDSLQDHPTLSSLPILQFAQGTNFPITEEHHKALQAVIGNPEAPHEDEVLPPYTIDNAHAGLFMKRSALERFLAALQRKKNVILQGPPGVGKTFVARRLAYTLIGHEDRTKTEMVQFHQSYAYEDFIQGWRPTDDGGFALSNGVFYSFCQRAARDPANAYVFIIDEVNRGNLSKIFGELLMLIEADKRGDDYAIALTYSPNADRFHIPGNLHLIGTMNTADRSLAMVDYALRRRFTFLDLRPEFASARFRQHLETRGVAENVTEKIVTRMGALNETIRSDETNLGPGFEIGHSFFCPSEQEVDQALGEDWYAAIVEHEIAPLLREYWFDNPDTAHAHIAGLR
jgi:5-methylcytosine-specific restriction protein B